MILNSERWEGIEEGSNQKQIEIVKKMLDEKIPLETISRLTDLSINEIEKIAK